MIPVASSRYVLAMGDGDDSGTVGTIPTMALATALKAPLDANYISGGNDAVPAKQIMGAGGGIGASLWGVTVGHETTHIPNWESAILAGPSANWAAKGWPAPTGVFEPRMIGNAMEIPPSQILSLPTTPPSTNSANIIDLYQSWYTADGITTLSNGDNVHYTHSTYLTAQHPFNPLQQAGDPLLAAFADFGTAASRIDPVVHKAVQSRYVLANEYSLIQYQSFPLVDASSTDTRNQPRSSVAGNTISWTIPKLMSSVKATIIFYVSIDPNTDPNQNYPVYRMTP